jgi:hypothetical protein
VIIDEYRDLSLEEWNFRKILQEHLENLLEKQRGIIKWACLGDENTKKSCKCHYQAQQKFNYDVKKLRWGGDV